MSEKIYVDDRVFTNAQSFREEAYRYYDRNMLYTPWNKLYRLDYIKENGLYFPQTLWDDFPFNISYIRNVESVVVSTKAYYHSSGRVQSQKRQRIVPICMKSGRKNMVGF